MKKIKKILKKVLRTTKTPELTSEEIYAGLGKREKRRQRKELRI